MDKIELDALVRKAELHDHEAQTILGEYYLNSPTNSNSNFSRAEKYLRMAAEKHQKQAMESLIKLYYKYMSFLITENKRYAQIAMCFRLGIK
jgi:TPR repeat protein